MDVKEYINENQVNEDLKKYGLISDTTKEYKFLVSICGGWCNGTLSFSAENEEKACNIAMDHVGKILSKAFPELDIPYDVELYEEGNEDPENKQCCETCTGWEPCSIQNMGVCIRYGDVTRRNDDGCSHWHGFE